MTMVELTRPPATGARAGLAAAAPFAVGYAPFAMAIGTTVATVDQPLAGWAGSWLVYGGSAHLAALRGIADGAAVLAVATALLVNARLLLYGTSMAAHWAWQPRWFRLLAPALLVDATWALALRDAERGSSCREHRRFFLAAGLTIGIVWSAAMAAGAVVGNRLPDVGLHLAAPLCLLALIGPRLPDRQHRWAAIAAAGVALVTGSFPAGTGLVAAIAAGAAAAHVAGRRSP